MFTLLFLPLRSLNGTIVKQQCNDLTYCKGPSTNVVVVYHGVWSWPDVACRVICSKNVLVNEQGKLLWK